MVGNQAGTSSLQTKKYVIVVFIRSASFAMEKDKFLVNDV